MINSGHLNSTLEYLLLQYKYGCETLSLALLEELRLRVFENRVFRMFGPKRDGVTGEWRKLHNEELYDLYCSPNIVRVIILRRTGLVRHMARIGRGEVLVKTPEGKRPVGRHRRRLQDNIKMVLQEVGCEGMEWIELC